MQEKYGEKAKAMRRSSKPPAQQQLVSGTSKSKGNELTCEAPSFLPLLWTVSVPMSLGIDNIHTPTLLVIGLDQCGAQLHLVR